MRNSPKDNSMVDEAAARIKAAREAGVAVAKPKLMRGSNRTVDNPKGYQPDEKKLEVVTKKVVEEKPKPKAKKTTLSDTDYIASLNIKDEKDYEARLTKKQFSGDNVAAKARLAAIRAQGAKVGKTTTTVKDTVTKPTKKEKVVKKSEPKPVTITSKTSVEKKVTEPKAPVQTTGHTPVKLNKQSTKPLVVPKEEKEVIKKAPRKNSRAYKRNYKPTVVIKEPSKKEKPVTNTGKITGKAATIASLERMFLNAKLTNDTERMKKYRLVIKKLKGQ